MILLSITITVLIGCYLIACGGDASDSGNNKTVIDGISVVDISVVYDGKSHGVEISGIQPTDKVEYSVDGIEFGEKSIEFVDVGSYTVYVRVKRDGAEFIGHGKVVIASNVLDGIDADDVKLIYDGNAHSVEIKGTLSTDTVEYSTDGKTYVDSIEFRDVGEYEVFYRVSRGLKHYSGSCSVTILPDLVGKYVNADKRKLVEITAETEYGVDGRGITADGKAFVCTADVLTIDGDEYRRVGATERIIKIHAVGAERWILSNIGTVCVKIEFCIDGVDVLIGEESATFETDMNYCENIDGKEPKRNDENENVEFEITGDEVNIVLTHREATCVRLSDKYVIFDGNKHRADFPKDCEVKVKSGEEYTAKIPEYSSAGEYEYIVKITENGKLPQRDSVRLVIYSMPESGRYVTERDIVEIRNAEVRINGSKATVTCESDGIKFNGSAMEETENGINFSGVDYALTAESFVIVCAEAVNTCGASNLVVRLENYALFVYADPLMNSNLEYEFSDDKLIYSTEAENSIAGIIVNDVPIHIENGIGIIGTSEMSGDLSPVLELIF